MVDAQVGQYVRANQQIYCEQVGGGGTLSFWVSPGEEGRITRLGRFSHLVRWSTPTQERSAWAPRHALDYLDDSEVLPHSPTKRPMGQKPEDTEDMTYIGTDHPGIQWLWDDMSRYASRKNWCGDYDRLVAELGIPGRKQRFNVFREVAINGVRARLGRGVMARSQEEAEAELGPVLDRAVEALRTSLSGETTAT